MIEFTIALAAIMAVAVGMILLNKIARAHTQTMLAARAIAGELALDLIYRGPVDATFIADWQPAGDNRRYTHDDEPIPDATAMTLTGDLTADAGLDGIPSSLSSNAIARLVSSPAPLSEFYLVKGSESMAVSLSAIPAVGRLFSGEPVIYVESEAWLTWTEGIY